MATLYFQEPGDYLVQSNLYDTDTQDMNTSLNWAGEISSWGEPHTSESGGDTFHWFACILACLYAR